WRGVRGYQFRAPHARGDGPEQVDRLDLLQACSPRTWGWSGAGGVRGEPAAVLPTHVGMVRSLRSTGGTRHCAPHARGDGPQREELPPREVTCSPRTWGWSVTLPKGFARGGVLPTHVGMVRSPRPYSAA